MGEIKLGEGHAAQRLAHWNRRIETIAHRRPFALAGICPARMILARGAPGQGHNARGQPCGRPVDKLRHGAVAVSQFCARFSGSWLVTISVMTATESAPEASTIGAR